MNITTFTTKPDYSATQVSSLLQPGQHFVPNEGRLLYMFSVLIRPTGAVVAEGGRVTIDRSKLDASNLLGKVPVTHQKDHHVMYRVISLPRHGVLSIRGHNLSRFISVFFISHKNN